MKLRRVLLFAVVFVLLGTVGFGESKRRTEKIVVGPIYVVGLVIGDCGSFEVLSDFVALIGGTALYDKSGLLVQEVSHYLIGESVYYNSTDPTKSVVGGPAESENDRIDWASGFYYGTGPSYKVRVPGHGVIFMETGHWVANMNTGEYVFNSGQNQFVDGDVAALCDYLK